MKESNCFDYLRYWASIAVILLHGTGYAYITMEGIDFRMINILNGIARLFPGVVILFALSGFVCTMSIKNNQAGFLKRRFKRIYPNLWLSMVINLVVICITLKGFSWIDISLVKWLVAQGLGMAFTPNCLKSFATGSINGALWTIMVQLQLYVVLALFYKRLAKISMQIWLMVILPFAAILNVAAYYLMGKSALLDKMVERLFVPYIIWFLIGVFCGIFFEQIKECKEKLLLISIFLYIALFMASRVNNPIIGAIVKCGYYEGIVKSVLCALLAVVIGIGAIKFLPKSRCKIDISYEMFLYHWIVLNVLVYLDAYNKIGWFMTLVSLFTLSIILAYVAQKIMRVIIQNVT